MQEEARGKLRRQRDTSKSQWNQKSDACFSDKNHTTSQPLICTHNLWGSTRKIRACSSSSKLEHGRGEVDMMSRPLVKELLTVDSG